MTFPPASGDSVTLPAIASHPGSPLRFDRPRARVRASSVVPWFLLALHLVMAGACDILPDAAGAAGAHARLPPPVSELASLARHRTLVARLSISASHGPCAIASPAPSGLPSATCADAAPPPVTAEVLEISARVSAGMRVQPDAGVLHAAGLIELIWGDERGNSLDRSITYLETSSRLSTPSGLARADLAAAYLVRAGRNQDPRDLARAVEAATEGLAVAAVAPAARFNLALALDGLGLVDQAAAAWDSAQGSGAAGGWEEEAARRSDALATASSADGLDASTPPREMAAFARAYPQEARLLGWDRLLGEWGAAMAGGDTALAARALTAAEAVGMELAAGARDRTLADQVRRIRHAMRSAAVHPETVASLASAHRDYAAARAAYAAGRYAAADTLFAAVRARIDPHLPLHGWVRVFHGASRMYVAGPAAAEPLVRQALGGIDSLRHPALEGRARWILGTVLLRGSRYQEALVEYRRAARALLRAGEREHRGAVLGYAATAEHRLGLRAEAYRTLHEALAQLRPYRKSPWLHSTLFTAAQIAATDGFLHTALRVLDEDVAVASRTGAQVYIAEAHLARARFLLEAGDDGRARSDLRVARAATARLQDEVAQRWFRNEAREVAATALRDDPPAALPLLDSIVSHWTSAAVPLRLLPPLVERAEARLRTGDVAAAEADLARVVELLETQRAAIAAAAWRRSFLDASRETFDRMVMLQVNAGRPAESLRYLDAGRASFSSAPAGVGAGEGAALPAGEIGLQYALIGDTLLTWTIAGTGLDLRRSRVDRTRLLTTVERARAGLELGAAESAVRPLLAELYEILIRPVEASLTAEGSTLVLMGDDEIAAIPFAALYDERRNRYLVEAYAMRFLPTLRELARAGDGGTRHPPGSVAVVGAEAASPEATGRDALPGAGAEVEAIRTIYGASVGAHGGRVGREGIEAALRSVEVLHFAGHAVFDDEHPARSHLVLAGEEEAPTEALAAADIEMMALPHLRLVVLSACETLRARSGRGGGFEGLAGAFLRAGASGVLGSSWRIDDARTRDLMVEFHRRYRAGADGPEALRAAQRSMLRSADPILRNPAAWAGFRYAGR